MSTLKKLLPLNKWEALFLLLNFVDALITPQIIELSRLSQGKEALASEYMPVARTLLHTGAGWFFLFKILGAAGLVWLVSKLIDRVKRNRVWLVLSILMCIIVTVNVVNAYLEALYVLI